MTIVPFIDTSWKHHPTYSPPYVVFVVKDNKWYEQPVGDVFDGREMSIETGDPVINGSSVVVKVYGD